MYFEIETFLVDL